MLIILARIIWQVYPNLWCCLGFWIVVLLLNRPRRKSLESLLVFVGAACNAVATVANGGRMPVLGKYGSPVSVWRAARPGDHMLILGDRFGGFSVGDALIGASFALGIGLWLWRRASNRLLSGEGNERGSKDATSRMFRLAMARAHEERGAIQMEIKKQAAQGEEIERPGWRSPPGRRRKLRRLRGPFGNFTAPLAQGS
jgi:hypothetical protein